MTAEVRFEPDQVNQDAWSDNGTLRWFEHLEGWSDPGEEAALTAITLQCAGVPILDIGVGAGRTIPMLRPLSADYRAIDFVPAMVDACRSKYPALDVTLGDARDLSRFDDDTFGLVVFSWNGIDAVSHTDRITILHEVRRVLRPGGQFFFSTHNLDGPGHGEKPWTIRLNDFGHLRHLAEVVLHLPRNLRNYLRHRPMHHDGDHWSMKTAAAHHFGIVIHYTTLQGQLAELVAAGFRPDPLIFDNRRGGRLRAGDDTHRTWWFQIVATA